MRALTAGLVALPVLFAAAPALADVRQDYMAACLRASGDNTELCTCKTEQAVKLADEEMLGYIIAYMRDPRAFNEAISKGRVPEDVVRKWPYYVRDSNKACATPAE
ncbi:MAG TPA: hypothetical protein GYA10_07180 [Alphaproteobacteria bacterium]|nr:hypothetical protein [Alphaproteobacteria bacterium]